MFLKNVVYFVREKVTVITITRTLFYAFDN